MVDRLNILLVLIPAAPLLAAIVTAVVGPFVPKLNKWAGVPTVGALAVSMVCSFWVAIEVNQPQTEHGFERVYRVWTWANVNDAYAQTAVPGNTTQPPAPILRDFNIEITLRADALTAMMLSMVTSVSLLVAIFAMGYMEGDRSPWRFFAYFSLFVFSMTMLVSVSNFVLLYVFWEAVGVCSYLLIGYWYQRPSAAAAGKKAFLVNRIGDFGFALGLFLIWTTYGTLNYHDEDTVGRPLAASTSDDQNVVQQDSSADSSTKASTPPLGVLSPERIKKNDYAGADGEDSGLALAICLLLMLGACGKSAQFPLHVWLPDAMEGPTPVSALIHAATMVTSGVYMVARCAPLFVVSPPALMVVATIGAFTALLAALIALTQYDLKRVLAFSTISQLGYMFLALGTGSLAGMTAALFHLFTHAFFKALLFLGAGSVMHAMGDVIDMRRFGGLHRRLKITFWTFLFGCLALAGAPYLGAGFFSKDQILLAVFESEGGLYRVLFWAASATALLTAFYTARAFFMTFYGPEKLPEEAAGHGHESPPIMWVPLTILAVFAFSAGWLFPIAEYLQGAPSLAALAEPHIVDNSTHEASHGNAHGIVLGISLLAALGGVGAAAYFYLGEDAQLGRLTSLMKGEAFSRLSDAQWLSHQKRGGPIAGIHRLAEKIGLGWLFSLIGGVLKTLSLLLAALLLLLYYVSPFRLSQEKFFIDEIYNSLVVAPLRWLAAVSFWFDQWVIDRLVNLCGWLPVAVGRVFRRMQTGLVQFYALAMLLGALVLLAARYLWASP